MSLSNEPTLDLRVPDIDAALTNFTHYIEHEAQLRYHMKSGPLEFRTRSLPLAPRRGEIDETLYWSAEDGCWYNIDKQEIVLREDIWKKIVSVINQLGRDTRSHYVYNAIREKCYYISQKNVRVACMEWRKNNLSLLDKYDDAPTAMLSRHYQNPSEERTSWLRKPGEMQRRSHLLPQTKPTRTRPDFQG